MLWMILFLTSSLQPLGLDFSLYYSRLSSLAFLLLQSVLSSALILSSAVFSNVTAISCLADDQSERREWLITV